MQIIGVLQSMRKKKHAETAGSAAFGAAPLLAGLMAVLPVAALFASLALAFPSTAQAREDKQLGTRNGGNEAITRDQATGDRVMQTPDPAPQPEYQGPQTIIVSPEVYPGGRPGRDGSRQPQRTQPRQ